MTPRTRLTRKERSCPPARSVGESCRASMLDCAAARAAVLQDANLLAEVLAFLPLPGAILLAREVARFWRDTSKRPLLRVALNVFVLERQRLASDAYVMFRSEVRANLIRDGDQEVTRQPWSDPERPAVEWLIRSFENGICSVVFDELGGYRKFVVDTIVCFLDGGLTRLLIVAQPSALRDWARMLQAAGVSCIDQVTADRRHEELCTRLHRVGPTSMIPAVLLRTPSQLELELARAQREGPQAPGIFGASRWQFAVFDVAPMVNLHETQQVVLSDRLKLLQLLRYRNAGAHVNDKAGQLMYVLLSASPPPTQLHKLAPLLQLCPWGRRGDPGADVEVYSRMLEVVDRFCMGDAETRRWALKDYLPSEVAYLVRPCLLHVHTPAAPKGA